MKNFFFLFAAASLLLSCRAEDMPSREAVASDASLHGMLVLGEQLEDPYSVVNITKALASVHPASSGRGTIEPTDYYVRFLPKNEAQLNALTDLGLELLDHPLDYRIVREGDWYHDPEVPEGDFTWQYTVVPVDFEFPEGILFEKLDDCYLSDHDPATKGDGIDWDEVEREAFRLTGNADLLEPSTRVFESAVPEGRIAIYDPDLGEEPIGVKGVKVSCNSFVKFASCFTDEEGNYHMSKSFSSKVRMRLVFHNIKGFTQGINLILTTSSISSFGKQPQTGFSITVDKYSERQLLIRCVTNNAVYDYMEASRKSSGAIPATPRDLRMWCLDLLDLELPTFMHHGVLIETMSSLAEMPKEYAMLIKVIQPDMLIGFKNLENVSDLYAKALHMAIHSGHFAQAGKDWWWSYLKYTAISLGNSLLSDGYGAKGDADCDYCEVAETYAYHCQNVLMRRTYGAEWPLAGTEWWFSPQLLMYLDERGLGIEKLGPLFTEDVTKMEELHNKLLSFYPPLKTIINESFTRYDK